MPRRPGPPPSEKEVASVCARPKFIDDTPRDILHRAQAREGSPYGMGADHPPWCVRFFVRGTILKATLFVRDAPVLGLDYHLRPADDGRGNRIPPGYHWDQHPPLVQRNIRIWIDPQPRDALAALATVAASWQLVFPADTQGRLL